MSQSINICYIVVKAIPSCSLYQAPSCEPNFTLLAWFLPKITSSTILLYSYWPKANAVYCGLLSIIHLFYTVHSAQTVQNKRMIERTLLYTALAFGQQLYKNHARDLKLSSFYAARDDEFICLCFKMTYSNSVAYNFIFH